MIFGAFRPGLVGAIGLYRDRHIKSSHRVHLWGMYVEPDHRRQGIGSHLLLAAIDYARRLPDVKWVHLSVTSAAPEAQSLYEAAGFHRWGTEPEAVRHDGDTADDHHMALHLE
jgi:ribosomal protein S18 acetylase RimI-like enzyme